MDSREAEKQTTSAPHSNGVGREAHVPDEPAAKRSSPVKRTIGTIVAAIAIVALLIFGIKYFTYARAHQSTDDARVDANTVDVTSKIGERVDKILVDTNQHVRKGQLLLALDSVDEQAKVRQAQANLQVALETQQAGVQQGSGGIAQARAEISNAQAQIPLSQAGVDASVAQVRAAQAQLPAAQAALSRAQADLRRTQSLVSTGDLPAQQLDAARSAEAAAASQYRAALDNINVAQANLNASQQKVSASVAGVGAAQGGLQTAQGKLTQAQGPAQIAAQRAALDIAKQNLKYTKIYAPIDGSIGQKNVEVGQTVQPGMSLLTEIPNAVFVIANFKETQVGDMRPGQTVDVKVDAYKGQTFQGVVQSINPASQGTYALVPAQNSTGNFVKVTQRIPVKIEFKNVDFTRYPMRPGMSVEAAVKVR
ncbi:MAG TPA: HlyD family secretion protein [Candidatus Baltobacteraceae bacterium]|jgi:membrane fusion protein (multidrug efflux system)